MRSLLTLAFCLVLSAAEPPKLRLGDEIRPVKYAAELTLVPGAATFDGSIDIDVTLAKPASLIWLNATELAIAKATVASNGKTQSAVVEPGGDDFIGLRVPVAITAGPATLHIQYQGRISPKNTAGIFRGKDGDETYLYSQFEAIDARRAFPCFDQPDFKTPWQLTLHIRKADRAFSNTRQLSETSEPNGMKRVVFAQTKPLPSYLVAVAVGPFEVVDAGHAGRNRVPVRIIVPKGRTGEAKYAAEVTATIIQRLEDYFGVPFPYEKVDNVAMAVGGGLAQENAGMVTYTQNIILCDPATDTISRQRGYASVAAHELAHQWFGDLVTTAWWDDIWLNEAFATWTSSKILSGWKPEWNTRLRDLDATREHGDIFGAMRSDSLITARQIRQPIASKDDISNAFDGITYQKGSAVIRMFETWMGEAQFQKGVNAYLTRYSYKSARVNDFLDSVASAGHPQLPHAFSTFLEQPGFPEISVELNCDAAPRVKLSQTRYLPIGSTGTQSQLWQTPVCVRYATDSGPQSECFLLETASAEFRLSKAQSCPAYLFASDNASGYYVAAYGSDLLSKLVEHRTSLNAAERVTLLHDLNAAVGAGHAKTSTALQTAQTFADAPEREVSGQVRALVEGVRNLLPPELKPKYERYVRKLFAARAEQLGWTSKPSEDDQTRLMRTTLVPFVARQGGDAALLAEARRLAGGWLANRKGVDADMLSPVLSAAAWSGDQELFDSLLHALKSTQDPQQRQTILVGLGSFHDPKMARQALALWLDRDLDMRQTFFALASTAMEDRQTRNLPFEFLEANYDVLVKRLPTTSPGDYRGALPYLGVTFCDETSRQEFVSFFQDRVKDYVGGPRNYANALESIRLCEARQAAQAGDLAEFFSQQ